MLICQLDQSETFFCPIIYPLDQWKSFIGLLNHDLSPWPFRDFFLSNDRPHYQCDIKQSETLICELGQSETFVCPIICPLDQWKSFIGHLTTIWHLAKLETFLSHDCPLNQWNINQSETLICLAKRPFLTKLKRNCPQLAKMTKVLPLKKVSYWPS